MGRLLLMVSWFTSLTTAAGGGSAPSAEVARGEHIARLVCSACHVVARDQEYPPLLRETTPSFLDIANRPGVSAQSLQHFITNTHWDDQKIPMTMPNVMMNKNDAHAVSLYIMSLRTR